MIERLPYEQHLSQQWIEVPLPDEDMAWADMKRRLEDDDDDGFIWWWRPGCGIIALLLVLGGLGWWMLRNKEGKQEKVNKEIKELVVKDSVDKKRKNDKVDTSLLNKNESGSTVNDINKKEAAVEKQIAPQQEAISDTKASTEINDTAAETETVKDPVITVPKKNTAKKQPADSPSVKKPNNVDSSKRNSFFFSAGLSVQQQLPIAGQKATPYNSLGRKGSLLDYIPSVYVRLNRRDKWFLQAEFKYGAPQYTKELLYHQEVIADTGAVPRFQTTTSNKLKKSFYHQLPFTFNYYIKPNWSAGGGLQWNKFYGAVSDQEIVKHFNVSNTDSVISKGIVVTKGDSTGAFEKSYYQAVFESQYKWKRFSFGARYTFGLSPYVRINIPNQPERKEKNSNILVFVRYELWQQKK
jgi:hypothetical protein